MSLFAFKLGKTKQIKNCCKYFLESQKMQRLSRDADREFKHCVELATDDVALYSKHYVVNGLTEAEKHRQESLPIVEQNR